MASEQFIALIEAVKADSILLEKLNSATDADSVVVIAKEAGFEITAAEVEARLEKLFEDSEEDLTAEQLEAVAGGAFFCMTGALVAGGAAAGGAFGFFLTCGDL